jgi:hypothetical protein
LPYRKEICDYLSVLHYSTVSEFLYFVRPHLGKNKSSNKKHFIVRMNAS